jgi:ComF family protein
MPKMKLGILADFISLIYPDLCQVCGNSLVKGEKYFCFSCLVSMPRTHYHLAEGNPLEQIFWGRTNIEKATSWFFYRKGSKYQNLLYQLKYRGLREIGVEMGRVFATELQAKDFFANIDVIVPVPLHPKKEKKRGYNQSLAIAEGLSNVSKIDIENDILCRTQYSDTQTRKERYARWENVSNLFTLKVEGFFAGKHVLLVDDVITTGSTIESCTQAIVACKNAKVSIVSLGFASL